MNSVRSSTLISRLRPRSVRIRLMLWNVSTLAIILVLLGGIIRYTVQADLMFSIDKELAERTKHPPGGFGPPSGNRPPDGPQGPPPDQRISERRGGDRFREEIWRRILERGAGPQGPQPGAGPLFGLQGPQPGEGPPPSNWTPPPPPMPLNQRWSGGRERSRDYYFPRLLDLQGKSMFYRGPKEPWDQAAFERARDGVGGYSIQMVDGEPIRVYSKPMTYGGKVYGVLQSPYPLSEVNRTLTRMDQAMLTLIPVALLLAGLGGAMLTDRALRPVGQLAQAAERIGAKELSQRLTVEGEDEFSHLAATFNAMLGRLEVAFAQREALVRQLEQRIEQEKRFTTDASHELKTPLTIIKANTSLLKSGRPTQADYREAIEDVDQAADTMSSLVQDLLLLSRHDGGQLARNPEPLPICDVLERARRKVRSPGAAAIRIEVADESLTVTGNQDEIVRLFSNLLDNAARYTPPDGEIRVKAWDAGDRVQVQVADTGVGIAPEHLPHLGERFYRIDSARSRPDGGTGLGLSICMSIVEAHQGVMRIESTLGKGTTVSITLPRSPSAFREG